MGLVVRGLFRVAIPPTGNVVIARYRAGRPR